MTKRAIAITDSVRPTDYVFGSSTSKKTSKTPASTSSSSLYRLSFISEKFWSLVSSCELSQLFSTRSQRCSGHIDPVLVVFRELYFLRINNYYLSWFSLIKGDTLPLLISLAFEIVLLAFITKAPQISQCSFSKSSLFI